MNWKKTLEGSLVGKRLNSLSFFCKNLVKKLQDPLRALCSAVYSKSNYSFAFPVFPSFSVRNRAHPAGFF
jgi:hypothetical protein